MNIPLIIHQIWLQGYNNIPKDLKEYHNGCRGLNNNFNHIFWDEANIIDLLMKNYGQKYIDLYQHYKIPAQKADFARYVILYHYGGIYLDMDMYCRKNLSDFLSYGFFFTPYSFADFFKKYLIGIIGARKHHPLFPYIFKNLFERQDNSNDVLYSTGTSLFYDSIQEYIKNEPDNDIAIIDQKYLNPCGMFSGNECKYACQDCYVVHMNNSSWSRTNKLIISLSKHKKLLFFVIFLIMLTLILTKCKTAKK